MILIKIGELSNRLLQTKDSRVQEDMDCFINSVNSLYVENCQFTFGTITQTNPSNDVLTEMQRGLTKVVKLREENFIMLNININFGKHMEINII